MATIKLIARSMCAQRRIIPPRTVLQQAANNGSHKWVFIAPNTVTYDYARNGGTEASKTSSTAFGSMAIDLTPTATKPGWEFIGWNTNPNATEKLSSLTMGGENVTLYAIFKQAGNVNFVDYNGTEIITRSVPYTAYNTTAGVTVSAPAQNRPAEWTARGWGVGTAGDAAVTLPPTGGVAPVIATYYGLYEQPITVTYDAAGGTPTPVTQTGAKFFNAADIANPVDPLFTMPAEPSYGRYAFGGWTDGTFLYPAWSNVSFAQDTNLFAQWNEIRVDGINLSQYTLVVGENDSATLEAFVQPANAMFPEYFWSSSDETIAVVDENGNVNAINSGAAIITATTVEGGFVANCEVTVMFVEAPIEAISISQSRAQLTVGDSLQLSAEVKPDNATITDVQWSSSDSSVAETLQLAATIAPENATLVIRLKSNLTQPLRSKPLRII